MPLVIGFDYGELWKWEDFAPSRLSSLMRSFDAPWWVAGGRALDLWMGRQTRAHQDVDVAILRVKPSDLPGKSGPDLSKNVLHGGPGRDINTP